MKKVLVIYYTQSGQLLEIAQNVVADMEQSSEVAVSYYKIQPQEDFDFPWDKKVFFNTFPESFLQIPTPLDFSEKDVLSQKYDLIILAYQIWYLTPSIPINSFLLSEEGQQVLSGTPVITVIGARNMWVMAQEKMKTLLQNCNAQLVGNIALVDRHINHISVITISKWMFTGLKKKHWGIFPKPGVSQEDINQSTRFGRPILNSLIQNNYNHLQTQLLALGAVTIKPFLVLTDKRANVLFRKWANFIIKKGTKNDSKRLKWVQIFKIYLLFAIWVLAPIVFLVFLLTYIPMIKKMKKEKIYYQSCLKTH